MFIAVAIYLDGQARPVFKRWVAHFNVIVAAALAPASLIGLTLTGPLAWDGVLSFWIRNAAIAIWIVVMGVVLAQTVQRQRLEGAATA